MLKRITRTKFLKIYNKKIEENENELFNKKTFLDVENGGISRLDILFSINRIEDCN